PLCSPCYEISADKGLLPPVTLPRPGSGISGAGPANGTGQQRSELWVVVGCRTVTALQVDDWTVAVMLDPADQITARPVLPAAAVVEMALQGPAGRVKLCRGEVEVAAQQRLHILLEHFEQI